MVEPIKPIPPVKPIPPIKPIAPVKPLPPLPKPETVKALQVKRRQPQEWLHWHVNIDDSVKPAELRDDYAVTTQADDKEDK